MLQKAELESRELDIVNNINHLLEEKKTQLDLLSDQNKIPERFIDPVSLEIMSDPVIATDGHHYDATTAAQLSVSPVTREALQGFIPDIALRSAIQDYLQDPQEEKNVHVLSVANESKTAKSVKDDSYQLAVQNKLQKKLDEMIEQNHLEGIKGILVLNILDLNIADSKGWTPLTKACAIGISTSIIELLLKYGADPNQANDFGSTPLMHACRKCSWRSEPTVRLLLLNGADPMKSNVEGNYAMIYAIDNIDSSGSAKDKIAKNIIEVLTKNIEQNQQKSENMLFQYASGSKLKLRPC